MTNYLLHGATLALVWFLIVNLAASFLAAWLTRRSRAAAPPGWWFTLRILPGLAASSASAPRAGMARNRVNAAAA